MDLAATTAKEADKTTVTTTPTGPAGLSGRLDTCEGDLKDMASSLSRLKSRFDKLRNNMFVVEMLRARRHLHESVEAASKETERAVAEGYPVASKDEPKTDDRELKREELFSRFKYRSRHINLSSERVERFIESISDARMHRRNRPRDIGTLPSKRIAKAKARRASAAKAKGQGEEQESPSKKADVPDFKNDTYKALSLEELQVHLPQLNEDLGDLSAYNVDVGLLMSEDVSMQLTAVNKIRKALSKEREPPIQEIIDSGVVPHLVHLLLHNDPQMQFEACWALTNIASGSSEQTRVVVDLGCVPIFVSLLNSPHINVCDQSIWALGNIAGDCPELRDLCIRYGIIPTLVNTIIGGASRAIVRNATWCLSNCCRGKNPTPDFRYIKPCLPLLGYLAVDHDDAEAAIDALWALSYSSDGPNEKIDAIIEAVDLRKLIQGMSRSKSTVVPTLRTLGNIVTGNDRQTQACLDAGFLPKLLQLLTDNQSSRIQKECCWAVSNITAGTRAQLSAVYDSGLMPVIVAAMREAPKDVAKEAMWTVANAASTGDQQQNLLLNREVVYQGMVRFFQEDDQRMMQVAADGLKSILGAAAAEGEDTIQGAYRLMGSTGLLEAISEARGFNNCGRIIDELVDAVPSLEAELA